MRKVRLPSERNSFLGHGRLAGDLPPGLVAAFRTTLEEIVTSSFLRDSSRSRHRIFARVKEVVEKTLHEIGAGKIPRLFALNKSDLLIRFLWR